MRYPWPQEEAKKATQSNATAVDALTGVIWRRTNH
jgi:hypothetical protein